MVRQAKRISIFLLVFSVAWLGFVAGRGVTLHVSHLAFSRAFGAVTAHAKEDAGEKTEKPSSVQERYRNLELFQKVLHFIENNYVEEVKNEDMIRGAIKGMLETLDPHSNFL